MGGHLQPGRQCRPRRSDRVVDLALGADTDLRGDLLGRRIHDGNQVRLVDGAAASVDVGTGYDCGIRHELPRVEGFRLTPRW